MLVKFADVVKMKIGGCAKCFSITYTLPYFLDEDLANYLSDFGKPIYPLNAVKVLRINAQHEFHIEGRLGTKTIKFVMPKKCEKIPLDQIKEKNNFEKSLAEWLTEKLNITVERKIG